MNVAGKITPLTIVVAFITLMDLVLGYAVSQVTGGMQITLVVFLIVYAFLFSSVFFFILWHRPYVFYPPSEYGKMNPAMFIAALRQTDMPEIVAKQLELAASVGLNPKDKVARFRIIDSLLTGQYDEVHTQYIILMHVIPCDLPFLESADENDTYIIEYDSNDATYGNFDSLRFHHRFEQTGFITKVKKDSKFSLTQSGHEFAQWLIDSGRKASFMRTKYGTWGESVIKQSNNQ